MAEEPFQVQKGPEAFCSAAAPHPADRDCAQRSILGTPAPSTAHWRSRIGVRSGNLAHLPAGPGAPERAGHRDYRGPALLRDHRRAAQCICATACLKPARPGQCLVLRRTYNFEGDIVFPRLSRTRHFIDDPYTKAIFSVELVANLPLVIIRVP
jgi:hypothetical protein